MTNYLSKRIKGVVALVCLLPMGQVQGLIPEPGNLIYGTVTVNGQLLSANDTQISLALNYAGKEIASYRMGQDAAAQNRYVLEVPMDSVAARNANALRPGDNLEIRYKSGHASMVAGNLVVAERGSIIELNLVVDTSNMQEGPDPNLIDTDGDGIPDVVEIANGLNPFDPSDALGDLDGDGVSNLDEYLNGTNMLLDDYPPLLYVPGDKEFSASGLFTAVTTGMAYAYDYKDGVVIATSDAKAYYPPGLHTINWSASDLSGNTATGIQRISVLPQVSFLPAQWVAQDSVVTIAAELNGRAATYPVRVPFTVSGSALAGTDHNLNHGEIVISNGALSGSVQFDILDGSSNGDASKDVIVSMGTPINAVPGPRQSFVAHIVDGNVAPAVSLGVSQNGSLSSLIARDAGTVRIFTELHDPNPHDQHSYQWTSTLALPGIDLDTDSLVFDASGLAIGVHAISVSVSDGEASSTADYLLRVVDTLPILSGNDSDGDGLSDILEGSGDLNANGVPDYLDAMWLSKILSSHAGVANRHIVETEHGLHLKLGRAAFTADDGAAQLGDGSIDVRMANLPASGASAQVVTPLSQALPVNAVYRKRAVANATLTDFVMDGQNAVYSAAGAEGYCPPPGDAAYSSGLTAGHWCVQLLIEDGGPNDADGTANRSISLHGVVTQGVTAASGGGGGSLNLWMLLLLGLFACCRKRLLLIPVRP